ERQQPIMLDSLLLVLVALGLMTFYLYMTFTQLTNSGQQIQQQSESLQETVAKLQQIRRSLEQRTYELSTTNEHLLATQRQLVEAEKMASLGNLVAGVSHEINTPLGIGITAATTLRAMTTELGVVYQSGDFRRAYFEEYLANADRSNQLIVNNLLRVDQLVQSFKQLAVDQLTLERRTFSLKAYLEEIVRGLEPRLRRGQHQVAILVDEALTIDSYPGAFAQVITNLLINSLVHGYPDDQHQGLLQFHATVTNGSIHLVYQDNGVGIPTAHMTKIYEPFFTTARDRGGTGLGLHIVYNLVTQKRGGTIRHESQSNAGVTFYLELPLTPL
ncbi:MAG: HAMP domain-containing histidine kinase, partial [Caldilineaceae bacterium]|nr:HAMP domain-containing histidine kinase [Caldilineaceae bacterium]